MSDVSEVGRIIRDAMTYARDQRGLRSDKALADQLGIDPVTLWRWTQGDVGRAAEILVPMVAAAIAAQCGPTPTPDTPPVASAAHDDSSPIGFYAPVHIAS